MFILLGNTPTLPNLDQTVTFPDSTAANTLMYTVSSSDNDPLDTRFYDNDYLIVFLWCGFR